MKKSIAIIIAIIYFGMLHAQETSAFTFNHIALSVKDIDKSAIFYKEVLQLKEITNHTQIDGIRWFSFGEGKELHLVSILKEPVTINKAVHFALTTANFDAFVTALKASKVIYSDWPGNLNKINLREMGSDKSFFRILMVIGLK